MKQPESDQQKNNESRPPAAPETGGGQGGAVEPGTIIPTDNSLEKHGEGDRTDTEEMYRLNEEKENR
jgi:hypothetical protein